MKKSLSFGLAILVSTSLLACSTPNTPNNQTNNTNSSTNNNTSKQLSSTDLAKADMVNLLDEEAVFSDSTDLVNDNSFSTKAQLGKNLSGEVNITANTNLLQRREQAKKQLKDNAKQMKGVFAKFSSAITVNDDGTITVDPNKLKEELKTALESRKEMMSKNLEKAVAKLKEVKELAKEKAEKLKRKNNIVRNSEKVSVTNADGSVTETMTVKFENTKLGLTRENTVAKTSKDGKVLSVDHSLKATTLAYTKTVTRLVTYNEDGSRTIKTTSVTEWKNGAKSERNEQRVVGADKTATGAGTLTVTNSKGESKTYNLSVGISASGEVTSNVTDNSTKEEVEVTESSTGETTQTVTTTEGSASETVDVEASVSADVTVTQV